MSHPTQLKCTQPNNKSENDVFKNTIEILDNDRRLRSLGIVQCHTEIWIMLEFRQQNRYHAVLFRPENLLNTRLYFAAVVLYLTNIERK